MPTIDPIAVGLVLIGAFYVFAGLVAARAALVSLFLDRALAAVSGDKPKRAETMQSAWMLIAANLVLAGGAALMLRLELALWLFLASLAGQALYLHVVAPRYFDVDDPPDAAGRRQTTNAFLIYGVATAMIATAHRHGHLLPVDTVPQALSMLAAGLVGGHALYIGWKLRSPINAPPDDVAETATAYAPPAAEVTRVAVMAGHYRFPLWSMEYDQDGDMPPEDFNLSDALCRDLTDWAEAYLGSMDETDSDKPRWTNEQFRLHEAAGRELAIRVARERPDLEVHAFSSSTGFEQVWADDPLPGGAKLL